MIIALDHIQIAMPAGAEDRMRPFYQALGLVEVPKPDALKGRGGFWAVADQVQVHFGIDSDFRPAKKAHPAFLVDDIDATFDRLVTIGAAPAWDGALPDITRFFCADPVGNRIEVIAG